MADADNKKNCKKWDKKNGWLVSNYCVKLCNTCDSPKRCKDDKKVKFIDPDDANETYSCSDLGKEFCDFRDKKKRLVKEYCRAKCKFCKKS
mmetsp:Transcript_45187/g.88413  ORF Transcript_45187/g.88413 Transcript_45187/m.88413 type:complete len:91 (-) Transcript_45187:168-440(-)